MPSASKVIRAFMESYAELKPDEARVQLLDLRDRVGELEDENRALREEVRSLKKELQRRKDMEFRDGGYYVIDSDREWGPICPECYTGKGLIYPLKGDINGNGYCTVCDKVYPGTNPESLLKGPFKL